MTNKKSVCCIVLAALLLSSAALFAQDKKALTFPNIMKFKQIQSPLISEDGRWVACATKPDRGDGEVQVFSSDGSSTYTIERGSAPKFSEDGKWLVATVLPPAADVAKNGKDAPKRALAILELRSGAVDRVERVERFSLFGQWLAYRTYADDNGDKKNGVKRENVGAALLLRNLTNGAKDSLAFVHSFAADSSARYLACAVSDSMGEGNGVYVYDLNESSLAHKTVRAEENGFYTKLTWHHKTRTLAFLSSSLDEKGKPGDCALWYWNSTEAQAAEAPVSGRLPENWVVPTASSLTWSNDGERIFFGIAPAKEDEPEAAEEEEDKEIDLFDQEGILAKRSVDVWHWNDPLINSQQKLMWPRIKDRTYTAVYHLSSGATCNTSI